MRATIIPCGPPANESELKCFEYLKTHLPSEPIDEDWILLTNLAFSVNNQFQSDEIDIIAIGPAGVRVIEVKHWTAKWVDSNSTNVEHEADRLTMKARKIGTSLRKVVPDLPRVDGAILLSQDPSKVKRISAKLVHGVGFHTLSDWKTTIGFDGRRVLSPQQVLLLANALQPLTSVAIDGSIRRLAGYVNLELQTSKDERFHRVYKGAHPARRDRVILHLYDLSANDERNSSIKASREFDSLHRLQLHAWAPRILDSYQDVPGYEGDMFFFTVVDPAAPSIEKRAKDATWATLSRLTLARGAVRALGELHQSGAQEEPMIHRNLSPKTILVKHDDSPILTGFEHARLPAEISIGSSDVSSGSNIDTVAPEVQSQGLAAADSRSDLYSLCSSLRQLFHDRDDLLSQRATKVFDRPIVKEPNQRGNLKDVDDLLTELLGESVPPPSAPPVRFWTEDQVIRFRDRDYRFLTRLGSGGVGTTFKVVEIDRDTKDELGTYVAKVAHERESGQRVLRAYNLVRSHLRHTALSTIFEVASEWQENEFVALMTWISGAPFSDYTEVFPLLAEDQQEASSEELALRWLRFICEALDILHRNGLIHGDVSPRNLIVSGTDLVLTDYDFVVKIGDPLSGPATVQYCSPTYQESKLASPSDDFYALAASFYHVVFGKIPFRHGGELDKKLGLNWEGVNREDFSTLAAFLDTATHHDPQFRFTRAVDALAALTVQESRTPFASSEATQNQSQVTNSDSTVGEEDSQPEMGEQQINWLQTVLESYPGSRWGNSETRGLDTVFAAKTYVETKLEETLVRDIREHRVQLVILCGNAGDGKTSLLQRLATELGLGNHQSSERILEGLIPNGPMVRMNLDGSASWRDRSADEILDEFLDPFQDGQTDQNIVHLLAINDGRLLEWINLVEERSGGIETKLTEALSTLLYQEADSKESHIRFINLNQRSLVGGITEDGKDINTDFLERLTDQLYGGDQGTEIWSPCNSCSAKDRCEVFRAARLFAPDTHPAMEDPTLRARARQRLFESLQAVHLGGETHITMRELRAALVYILFGVHYCTDYHSDSLSDVLPYWDRVFSADSPARQGEVLTDLTRFDPALEANPQIDRHLQSTPAADSINSAPHYPELTLESARRRAFFEWSAEDIEQVARGHDNLDLARGRHLTQFRNLPLLDERDVADTCQRLCNGISRLEDLPTQALDRAGAVPLRITPNTPTETAFWVEKPLSAFRLETDLPVDVMGVERLHRQAVLVYRYRDGKEERLRMGAELFHLLLELADGYQLGDVSTDDAFAHLSIFIQRLLREDDTELLAWSPMKDETIYRVSTDLHQMEGNSQQRMVISPLTSGDKT